MLPSLLIVFREVFEAGLIVGIVMAVTSGVAGRGRWIAGGVAAGVLGACLVALFAGGLSQLFGGNGQELFNAAILGFAVLMLGWHNVWMSRHGRELAADMRAAGEAVVAGSKSLAALVARGHDRGAARGFGSRTVSLRRGRGGRRRQHWHADRRRDWARSRRVRVSADLPRSHHYTDEVSVQRHQHTDRFVGRGHGRAGDRFSAAGRHPHRIRPNGVGHVLDPER